MSSVYEVFFLLGCFVPAEQARFRIIHEIFSKIRQHDNLFTGQSTFSSEINHIAFILNCMTTNSMVILDEVIHFFYQSHLLSFQILDLFKYINK